MTSLAAKTHKGRASIASKARTKKGKKASPPRKKKAKLVVAKPRPAARRTEKRATSKKRTQKGKGGKKQLLRAIKKTSKPPMTDLKVTTRTVTIKPLPMPPKRPPTPETLAAVRAFEHALKTFNRHDYPAAKAAFETLLVKYSEQTEVLAGIRPYLAICDQRLARTPAAPRGTDALYDRGVLEYNKGNTPGAISLFEKALRTEPRGDHIMYSLAAAHARMGSVPKTLDYLRRAIGLRPVHRSHARRDPDFAGLHANEDFQELVGLGLDLE
ncbi:MAG TPA: tetratricopeptide repeat protein [Blastocatellia bacterium]|nr:tetratricopeptide repeat protein [Blastocatellia bacterium]